MFFVLGSATLGFWAYQTCCEETSLEWQKHHFPSTTIWTTGLRSEGYSALQNTKVLSQALKKLPSRLDNGNKAWESAGTPGQPTWFAIYGVSEDSSDPIIFCLRCTNAPKNWEPVGEGWSGFEAVIGKAREQSRLYPTEKKTVSRRKELFDPHEIRY